ncbi:MAG: tripartite tricarboxylate transporter substrate binding protein [Betaproteobacteria bacterium]|nr:tripartite tricarboxylate transporter substrate binding protein [Betaproteobacteria bacterium]
MMKARNAVRLLGSSIAFAASATDAAAQSAPGYPMHAIQIVTPFAPGGGVELITRLLGARLSENLKQPVIVDARPGAGGTIGASLVARAAGDGYTLLMGNNSTHGVNQAFNPKLPYDTITDFTAISIIADGREVLLTGLAFPAKTVQELIALAKSKAGQFNYGSAGTGSHTHLIAELFRFTTGINIVHIPYKGAAPAVVALLGGETQIFFGSTASAMQPLQAGRLRALAITGVRRSPLLPELATLTEQGVKGFETGNWYALLGPAGIPKPVVMRLYQEIAKIGATTEFRQRLSSEGVEPVMNTPEECTEVIRAELAKWTNFVKVTGMRIE